MYRKIVRFFERHRLLDGYAYVLGYGIHYRVLATYSYAFHLFYLYLSVWKLRLNVGLVVNSYYSRRVTALEVCLPMLFRKEFVIRRWGAK